MKTDNAAMVLVALGIAWAALCLAAAGWLGVAAWRLAGSARTRAAAWWCSGAATAAEWGQKLYESGALDVLTGGAKRVAA